MTRSRRGQRRPPPRWASTSTPTRRPGRRSCCTSATSSTSSGGQSSAELRTSRPRSAPPTCRPPCPVSSGPARWSPPSGTFGHLRIFTFSVQDPVAFRDEFVRLAATAAAERADRRRPRQRRRAHLRQRVHPADDDAAPHRPGAGAVHQHAAQPPDLPPAQGQPGRHRPRSVVRVARPGHRDRRDLLGGEADHARGRRQRSSARRTTARSSWSPTPGATRRPTSSPPASPTTRSARSSASTTTPARAARTCGPTVCSPRC